MAENIKKETFLYIIKTRKGGYYTGITNDINRRLNEHINNRGSKYLKANGFDRVVHVEMFSDKGTAMKQENRIKKLSRTNKENLFDDNEYFLVTKKHLNLIKKSILEDNNICISHKMLLEYVRAFVIYNTNVFSGLGLYKKERKYGWMIVK